MTGHPAPDHHADTPQWAPPGYPLSATGPAAAGNSGLGVAGFVCGLLGLILCWLPFVGLILGVLGVVLGATGMNAARRHQSTSGLGIAGLVCGIVAVIPALVITVVVS